MKSKVGQGLMTTKFSLTIVCTKEGGGPLRRAEEVVHILFARVLLLSAPDSLNTDNCQWKFVFS